MTITDATISLDGRYRYRLSREWDASAQKMTFVMLNPSTADATLDDPTIRRCMGFARRDIDIEWDGDNWTASLSRISQGSCSEDATA